MSNRLILPSFRNLAAPGTLQVPTGRMAIDRTHPLTIGLEFCIVPSLGMIDLAAPWNVLTPSGSTRSGINQEGAALDCTVSDSTNGWNGPALPSGHPLLNANAKNSVYVRGHGVGVQPSNYPSFMQVLYSNPVVAPYVLTGISMRETSDFARYSSGGSEPDYNSSLSRPVRFSLGGTYAPQSVGNRKIYYFNGIADKSFTPNTDNQFTSTSYFSVGGDFNGSLNCAYIWSRELTAEDMAWLHVDPYGFLIPASEYEMSQINRFGTPSIIRPDADVIDGSWTKETGSQTDLYGSIDETTASDADFIRSQANPQVDTVKISFSNPGSVDTTGPMTLRYRFQKRGDLIDYNAFEIALLQGSTVIAKKRHENVQEGFTTGEFDLTAAQRAAISDYNDLYFQTIAGPWWLADAAIDLDFQNGRYFDSADPPVGNATITDLLTGGCGSAGTHRTVAGTITSFAANTLRLTDYGLLNEGTATNYMLRSQEFDNSAWTKENATVTANQAVAPDGTTTMDQIDDGTTATARHRVYQLASGIGDTVKGSIFVKDVDRRYVILYLSFSGFAATATMVADLQTGTITQSGAAGANPPTSVSAFIESFANGVYRISVTGVKTSATDVYLALALSDTGTPTFDANGEYPYTGSNKKVYAWGAQLEVATRVSEPTSYIPTTSATVTRSADAILVAGDFLTALQSSQVSFLGKASFAPQETEGLLGAELAGILCGIDDAGTAAGSYNGFSWLRSGAPALAAGVIDRKLAASWNATNSGGSTIGMGRSMASDGAGVARSGNAGDGFRQLNGAFEVLYIGSCFSGGSRKLYCNVKRLTVWASRLPDATLLAFTGSADASFPAPGACIDLDFTTGKYFVNPVIPESVLSISRASVGYAKNSDGTLQLFDTGLLRRTDLGLLVEDARTNLVQQSQTFNTWGKPSGAVTVTADAATALDGTTTADKLIESTTGSAVNAIDAVDLTSTSNVAYVFSCYMKAGETDQAGLAVKEDAGGVLYYRFVLSGAGSASLLSNGTALTGISASIELIANGWYRAKLFFTNTSAPANMTMRIFISRGGVVYTGDGTTGIYIWGAQCEVGAFESSYIPTTSASATRALDSITMTGALSTLFGSFPYSFLIDIIANRSFNSESMNFMGKSSPFFSIYNRLNELTVGTQEETFTELTATGGNFISGTKVGLAQDSSGRSLVMSGGRVSSDTASGVMTGGQLGGLSPYFWTGYIRRLTAWNSRLSENTLRNMST